MKRQYLLAGAALCLSFCVVSGAHAFCRTTTCDPNKPAENCEFDDDDCLVTGEPLAWRSSCVTVGVHELGSPSNGLSYDDVAPVVEQAFAAWTDVDCGGEGPSIEVELIGSIACGVSEYNQRAGNTNVVLFREDEWPYIGAENAIGLTTTRFDKGKGDLWDADIELNAVGETLSIGDPVQGFDLLSVLTHEAGHFLGLSHSPDGSATMKHTYDPGIDGTNMRSLEADDMQGICTVYPPGRKPATTSCENRHGFSEQCGADQPPRNTSSGCQLGARATGPQTSLASAAFALLLLGQLARRRRCM